MRDIDKEAVKDGAEAELYQQQAARREAGRSQRAINLSSDGFRPADLLVLILL